MLVLRLYPGEGAAIDDISVNIGECAADRARVTVDAPADSRVILMPEGVAVTPQIAVWRAPHEQIHIDEDVQIWIIRLEGNRVRIGFVADQRREITRKRLITYDDAADGL